MAATAATPFPFFQPPTGVDFTRGKGFNLTDVYGKGKDFTLQLPQVGVTPPSSPPPGSYDTGAALPKSSDAVNYYLDIVKGLAPLQRQQMVDAAQLQQQVNEQGFASAYPWIAQAAETTAARNLRDSKSWRAFVESQPTTLQNIAASKQAQMTSAAGAESDRARAIAAQTQAAKDFAGRYSGKYVSVG
jgi:hypothetical protein